MMSENSAHYVNDARQTHRPLHFFDPIKRIYVYKPNLIIDGCKIHSNNTIQ